MRLKIAMVCPYDYTLPGGVQSHVEGLSRELEARGHRVSIIAPRPSGALARSGAPCLFVGDARRIRFNGTQIDVVLAGWSELADVRRRFAAGAFDLVHYHTMWNPFLPLQIRGAARGVPAVATFHDAAPDTAFGRLARAVLMPVAGALIGRFMVDACVAVSEVPAAALRTLLDASRIRVIPNGVHVRGVGSGRFGDSGPQPDVDGGGAPPSSSGEGSVQTSFSSSTVGRSAPATILFVGRLEARKGVLDLVDAFAGVERRHSQARLVIAGDGYLRGDLRRRVAALGLRRVELVGFVSEAEKATLLAECDVFCSPARHGESFGIVLLEAMAAGRPVVAAANPGYREVLTGEGRLGLVPPGDVAALGARLSELVANPELRAAMSRWGLSESQRYDWPRVADRIEALYHHVLGRRRSGASPLRRAPAPRDL